MSADGEVIAMGFTDGDAPEGRAYLSDLESALCYMDANRRVMVEARRVPSAVCRVQAVDESFVACHPNHVRREVHGDETLWEHREGAVAATEANRA